MERIVTDYLEKTAEQFGSRTAFEDPAESLTFREVRDAARSIGQALILRGLFQKPVAIYVDKSAACILCMLGVAYSGNFYTVIDTNMPAARMQKIFSTLEPEVILCREKDTEEIGKIWPDAGLLSLEEARQTEVSEEDLERTAARMVSTDLLYVLFTSGSTGVPKGVVTAHGHVCAYLDAVTKAYDLSEKERFLNQAPFYFVLSIVEIFTTIRNGSTLYIAPKEYFSFPLKLMQYIEEKQITILYWVPSALILLANLGALKTADISSVKKVVFGGEVMPVKQLRAWQEALPGAMFVNAYGPTETTDGTTYYIVDREFEETETLPIGVPFENIGILVLDEEGKAVEKEGMGELCAYGPSITYGYYKDPEKTAGVFTQNPVNTAYRQTIYHTGDLVQYNAFGELEYAGRKDFQIKHHGQRIELGEIEACISSIEGVEENCCLYDSQKSRIVLFYSGQIEEKDLQKKAKALLPSYMLPNRRYHLEAMPHNLNGKIDRAELKKKL